MRSRKSTVRLKPDALRAIAARNNQTLDQLARILGINDRYFYRLLSGEKAPTPQTRAKICQRLGIGFDDAFELVNAAAEQVAS